MTEPSLQLGGGNWAGKSGNLLAYHKANNNFYADELTFTRASTGTRVNADGLIEEVPYNKITYSNDFSNAAWIKTNSTITANTTTSPDGTQNASTLVISSSGYLLRQYTASVSAGGSWALSIFAKNQITNFLRFGGATPSGTDTYSIQDVGNGWYRHSLVRTFASAYASFNLQLIINEVGTHYIYGGQIEQGSTAKPYFPTTTRLNFPRVDYLNNPNGSLKLEPQRTNFITQSSNLSLLSKVAVGTASPPVTTANYATSPDGTQNATRVVFDLNGGSDRSILRQAIPLGSDYYFSIYVKSTNGTDQKVMFHDGDEQNTYTVTNEWQRITYDGRSGISYAGIALTGDSGVDTSDILVWGFQVEQGSYATSIINTAGATVTRLQDSCLQGGFQDKNIFGTTQGSAVFEFKWDIGGYVFDLSDSSGIRLRIFDGGSDWKIRDFAGLSWVNTGFTKSNNVKTKIGFKWNGTQFTSFQDGVKSSSTDSFASSLAIESITNNKLNNTSAMQFYNTALTDQELITLTTL